MAAVGVVEERSIFFSGEVISGQRITPSNFSNIYQVAMFPLSKKAFWTFAMNDIEDSTHRQQNLYFQELFELKVACDYMRRYRD
jgi:hypothetical protein